MGKEGKAGCVPLEGGVGVIMSVHPRGCAFYLLKKLSRVTFVQTSSEGVIAGGLIKFILKFF